ncbi:DUF2314 domain-containing protein [Breznakiella homolactica]|uniref:DUF2314 domain-containing protein n=1 Tax=Breznakiella homolactica TaxID=2798577 RepID=A0A7T7XQB3_9SPIR|nr:DUF2314 domain-containing protein [Breznakiella homolactica]QQO10432.1 DUF2314 domain-containing protein [Breznakiella homolactica]
MKALGIAAAIAAAGLLGACGYTTEKNYRDPVVSAEQIDSELVSIREAAREGLPEFIRQLQAPEKDEYNFQVKYPFETDPGGNFLSEHIWLRDISFENNKFSGVVSNVPLYISGLSIGDRVPFYIDDISDWMYMKDGKIRGGLSIKYLLEKTPPMDRDETAAAYLELFE